MKKNLGLLFTSAMLLILLTGCTEASDENGEYKKHFIGLSDNVTY